MTTGSERKKGLLLVLCGGTLWGGTGVLVQFLFQEKYLDPTWLAAVRMLVAGILMVGFDYQRSYDIWAVWRDAVYRRQLLAFGIFGMLGTQYTYYLSISYGNAATATVLQYLMPIIVLLYMVWRWRRLPNLLEGFCVFLAVLGTYLLITKGQWATLAISRETLFWGVLSAFGFAFYTLQPRSLLLRYSSATVIGWSMVIGGGALEIFLQPWQFIGIWDWQTFMAMAVIIFFGTIIAFYAYLESTKYISPSEVSALSSVEPLSSVLLSVIFSHVSFGLPDGLGILCILGMVFLLAREK